MRFRRDYRIPGSGYPVPAAEADENHLKNF